jgi:hypothetical protein
VPAVVAACAATVPEPVIVPATDAVPAAVADCATISTVEPWSSISRSAVPAAVAACADGAPLATNPTSIGSNV